MAALLEQKSKVVLLHVVPTAIDAFDDRKPFGERPCFRHIGRISNDIKKLIAVHREGTMSARVRHRVARMPGKEHPPRSVL
jgi:hypothetical protein